MTSLLGVDDLSITFRPGALNAVPAVESATFSIEPGEILGLVGESGCGKSVSSRAILDLLPDHSISRGTITYKNRTYNLPERSRSELRGREIGMVFQDPMSSLNPLYKVGDQLTETIRYLEPELEEERREARAFELLNRVGMDDPDRRAGQYSHELSGGLRQRAMLALALAGSPDLIIADEPTSALDITLQRRIMELFVDLAEDGLGVLLISHDLPMVGHYSDRICVMYSGFTVEEGPASTMNDRPRHPYTQGLLASSRAVVEAREDRLPVIPGEVPTPAERPEGCPFHPRCGEAEPRCEDEFPPEYRLDGSLNTACWAREGEAV